MENLRSKCVRDSMAKNYFGIWRNFNKFLIRLDSKPPSWEEKVALYCTYMIENGSQSSTVKSYVSAIKRTLKNDGYEWCDNKLLFEALVKACKLRNDHVTYRFPIRVGLLELLLFETERLYSKQSYLVIMYQALLGLGYYGLMRIEELTESDHTLKAKHIFVSDNKNKIIVVLYTSKTHDKS